MKVNRLASVIVFLSVVSQCSGLFAAPVSVDAVYPQYRLTPPNPSMNDSVSFYLVKGLFGSSCPPGYRTSFSIVQTSNNICVRAPCPQDYTIKLTYAFLPVPLDPNVMCLAVMTEYGPRFNFGKLAVGAYTMVDSSGGNTMLMKFTVSEHARVRGIVAEDTGPLDVFKAVANCKVIYSAEASDSVMTDAYGSFAIPTEVQGDVGLTFQAKGYNPLLMAITVPPDTMVRAKLVPEGAHVKISGTVYEATPSGVIGCAPSPVGCVVGTVPGCSVAVQRGNSISLFQYWTVTDNQGKYGFDSIPIAESVEYANVSAYKAGFVRAEKADTLRVKYDATANFALLRSTATPDAPTPLEKAGQRVLSYAPGSKTLRLVITKPQYVSLSAYILNSRKVEQLSRKRYLAAGTYAIGLRNPRLSGGVIVFRAEGEGFSESLRINLMK